ncbi:hypothetical protein L917_02830 [Phytophthora nicotianae]|uniref:Uncharacterized protein n=1 Tax=Phytophthora nicotianae TaxID=4792 RepID=W2LUX0_PHYNI|nr:hypothetical protein L917_02830 [Phytophthora nicotianae]
MTDELLWRADNGVFVRLHEKIIALNGSVGSSQIVQDKSIFSTLWLSTKFCGLFRGASYTFRAAAMNSLCAGHWSHSSSRIQITPVRRRLTSMEIGRKLEVTDNPKLKGVGDPNYIIVNGVDILSQSDLSVLVVQDPRRILRASGVQIENLLYLALSFPIYESKCKCCLAIITKGPGRWSTRSRLGQVPTVLGSLTYRQSWC